MIDGAIDLLATTTARGRDAFIAATALLVGFDAVVTMDSRFVEVPGLRRIHPRDLSGASEGCPTPAETPDQGRGRSRPPANSGRSRG